MNEGMVYRAAGSMIILTTISLVWIMVGCADPFLEYCETVEMGETTLSGVDVEVCQHEEPFGGEGSMSIRVHIKNDSDDVLTECIIVLNDDYAAPLDQVEMQPRFLRKARPRGRATILPGEEVRFSLCHDSGNRDVFRSPEYHSFPLTMRLNSIRMEAPEGRIAWQVLEHGDNSHP